MASEFLADIEGKLEKLTEPHHVSKLSRYDSYILELTQYIVALNDQTLSKIQSHRHSSIFIVMFYHCQVVYYLEAIKKFATS